jgi:hypothetical protein
LEKEGTRLLLLDLHGDRLHDVGQGLSSQQEPQHRQEGKRANPAKPRFHLLFL